MMGERDRRSPVKQAADRAHLQRELRARAGDARLPHLPLKSDAWHAKALVVGVAALRVHATPAVGSDDGDGVLADGLYHH